MTGIALAVLSLLAAPAPPKKIAVVAVGQDANAAGALQRSLEGALARQGATLASSSEIAAQVPAAHDAPASFPAAEKAVAEAQNAYFANETGKEGAALKAAAQEVDAHPEIPISLRMRYYVTAIAINLKLNRPALADDAARQMLGLGAQKPPDLDDFPPAVAELLEATRTKVAQIARVKLDVTTVPANATLSVDGVDREAETRSLSLRPGRHVISARAAGYAPVSAFVDTAMASVTVALPLRVAFEALPGRDLSAADRHTLEQLAQAGNADFVVAATTLAQGKILASVWPRGATRVATDEANSADAASEWILRTVAKIDAAKTAAAPSPTPGPAIATHRPPAHEQPSEGSGTAAIHTDTEAALAFSDLGRSLAGSTKSIYSVQLNGAGPRLRAGVRTDSGLMADVEVLYLDILTTIDAKDSTKTPRQAKPGSFLAADLGAGYAFLRNDHASLGAALLGGFEQFSTGDLPTERVFSGWSAAHAGAELRGAYDTGNVLLSVHAGAFVPLSWKEAKADTSGTAPSASPVPRARVGVIWRPSAAGKVSLGADAAFEARHVSFSSSPVDGNLKAGSNAKLDENDLRAAIVFRYAL